MHTQSAFAAVLLAPTFSCPPGLKSWNGSDPAKRFAVYRNNVMISLVDALADSYPVVQELVGEEFFRAMVGEFVRQAPPRSPVLAWYGAGFESFIADFPPVAGLPYLADVAALELLRVEAWHAADASPMPMKVLGACLADTEHLPGSSVVLHPALRVMHSAHPVVTLWAAHQADDPTAALAAVDLAMNEAALLVRPHLEVEIIRIEPAAAEFIRQLQAGASFGAAAASANCDLAATLGLLLRSGAVVQIVPSK